MSESSSVPSGPEPLTPTDRLIVALDVETEDRAIQLVENLSGAVGMFKVGCRLFTAAGPGLVKEIKGRGGKVFLDLKYHDIPNVVAAAAVEAARLGITLMTLHASGGEVMLRTTADAVRAFCETEGINRPRLLGVTVLTSLGFRDLQKVFVRDRIDVVVAGLAALASEAGMDGVVTSPQEALLVRHRVRREEFIVVTPGVRPSWASIGDDQQRVLTPREALQEGADYVVVGRPVTAAPDPAEAAAKIVEEMRAYVVEHRDEEFRRRFQ